MFRFSWITVLAVISAPLPGQEAALIGVVRDSTTGRPLPDVTVTIGSSDLSTRTGPDGFFRLLGLTSGDRTVFVRKAGYEPWAMRMAIRVSDERDISVGVIRLAAAFEASFFGIVIDSASGRPIAGAIVSLADQIQQATTDDSGAFEIPGIRSGTHEVMARRIGYKTWSREVALSIPRPVRVDFGRIPLAPAGAVTLEDIRVEGEEFAASSIMTEFFTRRRTEQGEFLTYEDIERLNPKNTSDIFRGIPGLNANRNGVVTSGRGLGGLQDFNACVMQYYVDGTKVTSSSIDVIQPRAIAGIEVYRGAATTPQIFRSQSNANCGVIVIWTKDGRS